MAKTNPTSAEADTQAVQARVLVDCVHGKPNDVVSLSAEQAQQAQDGGLVDSEKAAVAYALSLKTDQ